MAQHGKKYRSVKSKVENLRKYSLDDAVKLVLDTHYVKFDESVDAAVILGVDPKKADQNIRSSVVLPYGTGRVSRVLVIAKGEKLKEAEEAGADYVGGDEMIAKIQGGWLDFDRVIATPDVMGMVGRVAKILGPRGLMPNAKTGTVTFEVAKAINEIKAGKVDFRVDKAGVVHAPMGRVSFGPEKIIKNFTVFIETLNRLKPSTSKGTYVKGISLSATMGPGVRVDTATTVTR
ncbi:MAG: 50S ribosomal protein L1 [Desulfobacteraceae bacterium]|nr:50S ribosomal protein L1 [Desulfobacteraceae bacterium]